MRNRTAPAASHSDTSPSGTVSILSTESIASTGMDYTTPWREFKLGPRCVTGIRIKRDAARLGRPRGVKTDTLLTVGGDLGGHVSGGSQTVFHEILHSLLDDTVGLCDAGLDVRIEDVEGG